MLEKTIKAIQEMDAVVIQAAETKKKTFEYINANYRSKSELINQKIEEMNNAYNEVCGSAAQKVAEVLEVEVKEAEDKINAIVCAEVPSSFNTDLTVIQARQGKMTDYEVELYVNKYIHNYPATAALNAALGKEYKKVGLMRIVQPDKLIEELNQRKEEILNMVNAYNPTGYAARLMRTENNPLENLAARVQSFIDGNFMVDMDKWKWGTGAIPV